jgi:hypothetical protein
MDYGEGIAAPIGGYTTTNDERRGGERREGPPDDTGGALRDRPPRFLSERDVARRLADEGRGGLDLIDGHTTTCRMLDVNCGDVSPEDFRRGALSDDPRVQVSRLKTLFRACGIVGVADEVERADVVRVAAEYAPRSEGERQLVFQAIATHFMALRSAGEAMSGRHAPQVASLCTGDFVKVSKLHASLQGTLQAMRPSASPPPTEIHGHVHLHAGGVPPMLVGGADARPSAAVRPALAAPDIPCASDADTSGADLL